MKKYIFILLILSQYLFSEEVLKVEDSLLGSTKGVMEGGELTEEGWVATAGPNSRITYDLGEAYGEGRFEVELKNFLPCQQPNAEKCHIITMYQTEKQDRDSVHLAGESYFILRTGTGYFEPCEYKILTRPICEPGAEIDYEARVDTSYQWDSEKTYKYSVIWRMNGNIKVMRDQDTIYDYTHIYPTYYRYILIGRDKSTKPNYGEQPGTVYKNLKVYVNEASKLVAPICSHLDGGVGDEELDLEDSLSTITIKIYPTDDTFVSKAEPDSINGHLENIQVGGDGNGSYGRVIFLKFDLSNVWGYEILSARVVAFVVNAGYAGGISKQRVNDWEEETLTYNNMPLLDTKTISDQGYVSVNDTVFWDVDSILTQGEVNSFNIISFYDDGSAFYSKEYSEISKRPYLEIVAKYKGTDAGMEEDGWESEINFRDEVSEALEDSTDFVESDILTTDEIYENEILNDVDNIFIKDTLEYDISIDIFTNDSSSSCSCNLVE